MDFMQKFRFIDLKRFLVNSWSKLWFIKLSVGQQSKEKAKLSVPNIKVWSTFSKVVVVGNAHKIFHLLQILDSQTACLLAAWT